MTTGKRIIAVHGGGAQPTDTQLRQNWLSAIGAGIARDWQGQQMAFESAEFEMPCYAQHFAGLHEIVDEELDKRDRLAALRALTDLKNTRAFRRSHYERLPGKSALAEFVADVAAPALGALGLGKHAVERVVPEFRVWWDEESPQRLAVLEMVQQTVHDALSECESVALIAHGFGAVVAYDVLWRLGREHPERKLDLLITCGAPVANNTIRGRLAGADEPVDRRFPLNLFRWHNLSAEDDYLCHDKTVADDFAPLLQQHQISELVDHTIYNLSVRYGRSQPGHSAGYLIHPRMAELLATWLKE